MAVGLFDLTRIYFRVAATGQKIDYAKLLEVLEREVGEPFDRKIGWTAFDPQNGSQQQFVSIMKDLGFEMALKDVEKSSAVNPGQPIPRDQKRLINELSTRFDAEMGYSLARLVTDGANVVMVTDSYPMAYTIGESAKVGDSKVYLAAFQDQMDPRWSTAIREGEYEFIDLGEFSEEIIGRPRVDTNVELP